MCVSTTRLTSAQRQAAWRKRWPAKHAAEQSLYRARRQQRVPPWLTSDQKAAMRNIYTAAREASRIDGRVYHVDHVVPLVGLNVSGLHVPWNLQILPGHLNSCKRQHYEGVDAWPLENQIAVEIEIRRLRREQSGS